MISKNGLIAALWTAAIIGGFTLLMLLIKNYPQYMGAIFAICVGVLFYFVFVYPLWDTIKYELDERDRKKGRECKIELDFDEDDKAQIG